MNNGQWSSIPSLVLSNIYGYLECNDRIKISSVCWNWRYCLFQPRFLKNVYFDVAPQNEEKNLFFLESLLNIVSQIVIEFDYLKLYEIKLTTDILQRVSNSPCLTSLKLRPRSFKNTDGFYMKYDNDFMYRRIIEPIVSLLSRRTPSIKCLDIGGCEQLSRHVCLFLEKAAKPHDLKLLGLATIKQNPSQYPIMELECTAFEKCTSLQVLSIDYDIMCDEYLKTLELLPLKKLIIHVHGLNSDHADVSENAWKSFKSSNSTVELHLSLINAYEAVADLQTRILRSDMPLTHLKVLFCEWINIEALEYLSQNYEKSLKSVIWVDSGSIPTVQRNDMDLYFMTEQDPLVMMAWKCHNLHEIVIHGYAIDPHNLVGIARLRGKHLKNLEVSMKDLTPSSAMLPSFIDEISTQLDQKWAPKTENNLHPAINSWNNNCIYLRSNYIIELVRSDIDD